MLLLLEKHYVEVTINAYPGRDKGRLRRAHVPPVFVYGSEASTVTKPLARQLNAFDTWSLQKIIRIQYSRHVANVSVRETDQLPSSFLSY